MPDVNDSSPVYLEGTDEIDHAQMGRDQLHEIGYVQATDPGAVGARKTWIDTSKTPFVLKIRNQANDGWTQAGSDRLAVTPPPFIGCRTYLTSDWQVGTTNGWQIIDYDTENYDTDSIWSSGGNHNINTAGYYHVSAQVTIKDNLPTSANLQVGIFHNYTAIAMAMEGYYDSSTGTWTITLSGDYYSTDSDYFNLKILVDASTQPTVLSGADVTFLCTHMIRGVVADAEDQPQAVNAYCDGFSNDIPNETWTEIDYDKERYDTDDMFDPTTSKNDLNINTAGTYNIVLQSTTHGQNGVTFDIAHRIVLNGTTVLATVWDETLDNGGDRVEGRVLLAETDYQLSENDVITAEIWQNSGSSHNDFLRPGDGNTYITLHRIESAT
jgi:hypothetical protein